MSYVIGRKKLHNAIFIVCTVRKMTLAKSSHNKKFLSTKATIIEKIPPTDWSASLNYPIYFKVEWPFINNFLCEFNIDPNYVPAQGATFSNIVFSGISDIGKSQPKVSLKWLTTKPSRPKDFSYFVISIICSR